MIHNALCSLQNGLKVTNQLLVAINIYFCYDLVMATKTVSKPQTSQITLKAVMNEITGLRNELRLLFPQESLTDYAHPERIKKSFSKAIKQYPHV